MRLERDKDHRRTSISKAAARLNGKLPPPVI